MCTTQQRNSQLRSAGPRASCLLVGLAICVWALAAWGQSPRVVLTPATGFTIVWDGNDGGFSSPDAGAGPSNNVALGSNGTTPFTSSDLGPVLSIPFHRAINLNDGLYGNSHSWISANGLGGTSDPDPFAGLAFAASVNISSIAWGRDNGDTTEGGCTGGTCVDRNVGIYTLQYTTVTAPDATTAETGDPATGWVTIGTVQYLAGDNSASFSGHLRHRFDVKAGGAAIAATGIRIKVSDGWTAIDEIEVNPPADPVPPISNFVVITPAPEYTITWDRNEGIYSTTNSPAPAPVNDASTSRGAVAFGSSQLDFGVHFIRNVNDGLYGNAHSWIPDFAANPDPAPFIGINFGRRVLMGSLAWSRDNGDVAGDCCGGTLKDRALGLFVIQITTAENPGLATPDACGPTPEAGWVTIGTINYKSDDLKYFNSYLRHRFDLAQGGQPIPATGIRIKVPNNQSDVDEIEVNGNLAIEKNAIRFTNALGFTISWDGNNGQFNNPAVGAAPPDNRALATQGTTPFTSSDLGPVLSIPMHRAINLNDGLYGNANSWISANGVGGTSDPDPFAGLNFGGAVTITNIAWGRDNGNTATDACGGTCTDRSLDTYRLQYTRVENPDATTPDTGDAATGWQDIGTITYASAVTSFFTPYLRHRFDLSSAGGPIEATGIRIKVANGGTDIDEIEVNTLTEAPPPLPAVGITPELGYTVTWDGNDGYFFNPAAVALAPPNAALAVNGTTAFGSSELGLSVHFITNVNDSFYGNSHSWIPDFLTTPDPAPYIGLNFGQLILMTNIAWSRDNGNTVSDACGGTCMDRALGVYTLQVTTADSPGVGTAETGDSATGWATFCTIEYRRDQYPDFRSYMRHCFNVSAGGAPIEATGLRIKVLSNTSCIDEIEVNTVAARPLPKLTIGKSGNSAVIFWTGGGGLEGAPSVMGPWACLPDAISPYPLPAGAGPIRFYRVRR